MKAKLYGEFLLQIATVLRNSDGRLRSIQHAVYLYRETLTEFQRTFVIFDKSLQSTWNELIRLRTI